jgi:hypothetical protein
MTRKKSSPLGAPRKGVATGAEKVQQELANLKMENEILSKRIAERRHAKEMVLALVEAEEQAYELKLRPHAVRNPLAGLESLVLTYRNSVYTVDGLEGEIRIGQLNPQIDAAMGAEAGMQYDFVPKGWGFLTAQNPMSKELKPAENKRRNIALLAELKPRVVYPGIGGDKESGWEEESFLVMGISLLEAKQFARKHGQQAFLFGEMGKACGLYVRYAEGMVYHRAV